MSIFYFYAFDNKASEEAVDLFGKTNETTDEDTRKPRVRHSSECLGSFFATNHSLELPVQKITGKGKEKKWVWDKHKCEVLRNEGGVILMTVEANKSKHTTIDKKDVEHQHHPFSTVLIDNRPGRQMIGIERNSAFDGNPDKLAEILQKSVSNLLSPYGRKIELLKLKKKSDEFWPVVDRLRTQYKDRVKQIKLDMSGKDGEHPNGNMLIGLISDLAKQTQSEASLMLCAEGEGEVKLQEVQEDVSHIAAICLEHKEYDLSVKFEKFGVYRYGADLLAQFGVEDNVLDCFENGSLEFNFDMGTSGYALTEWLDKLNTLLNDYERYIVSAKRKALHRRKVL